jgi:hypothetical protein
MGFISKLKTDAKCIIIRMIWRMKSLEWQPLHFDTYLINIYGPPMAKNIYGPPMAKNIYGPLMAKNIYGPILSTFFSSLVCFE